MTRTASNPVDQNARDAALDTRHSVIVQAPAGSGKTDLLTKRFLKLLAEVEAPEQILAITFTRAATAEMRQRILESLEAARNGGSSQREDVLLLARRALQHSEVLGWKLLEQPHRLQIETVDSFCRRIAQKAPMLSRLGGMLNPTEDADALYRLAARRTLEGIGSSNRDLQEAVSALLEARDNNLADCEELIVKMLARRDQWSREFVLAPEGYFDEGELRENLERPMQEAILRAIRRVHGLLANYPNVDDLLRLARYACSNLQESSKVWPLRNLETLPVLDILSREEWAALPCFLLSNDDQWRKRASKIEGFPAGKGKPGNEHNQRFLELLQELQSIPGLLEALCELRYLPPAHFTDKQWERLKYLFRTLRHASAELRVVFAEQNQVDFVELGIAARAVLRAQTEEGEAPSDIALAQGERIRHLLFDEFQDTSRSQHQLLEQLMHTWNAQGGRVDDGRTCFIVGDPMQSIYSFRQAEVELFQQVQHSGFETQTDRLIPNSEKLQQNFRSGQQLVEQMNAVFGKVFGLHSAVPFVEATPVEQDFGVGSNTVHAGFYTKDDPEERDTVRTHQRKEIACIARQHLEKISEAVTEGKEYRVAILARAAKHLLEIAQELRDEGVPFRAVEMEQLNDRQEILDLKSLVRALIDPMDRISWLSVLRSPWCGLDLRDLHLLCGEDGEEFRDQPISKLIEFRATTLSSDGQLRLNRLWQVLERAHRARFDSPALSFGTRIERIWYSLGGPACIDDASRENAQMFFAMLDELPDGELSVMNGGLEERLQALCAQPDPQVSDRCGIQLMTIHKSKGLGFDVVLIPALERPTAANKQELLLWLERAKAYAAPGEEPTEILIAPIQERGEEDDPLLTWVRKQIATRDAEERKRLLYVACTRARRELHLFGVTAVDEERGVLAPKSGTLLATAWPALELEFRRQFDKISSGEAAVPELELQEPTSLTGPKRLPIDFVMQPAAENISFGSAHEVTEEQGPLFERPEAGMRPRIFGTLVHELMERAAQYLEHDTVESLCEQLEQWKTASVTQLRSFGIVPKEAEYMAQETLSALRKVIESPEARWILSPHPDAASEVKWMGVLDDKVQAVQMDRIFRAGNEIGSNDGDIWWIVDYKTSTPETLIMEEFLEEQRQEYSEQLAAYARVLRLLHGEEIKINAMLYYPLLQSSCQWPV